MLAKYCTTRGSAAAPGWLPSDHLYIGLLQPDESLKRRNTTQHLWSFALCGGVVILVVWMHAAPKYKASRLLLLWLHLPLLWLHSEQCIYATTVAASRQDKCAALTVEVGFVLKHSSWTWADSGCRDSFISKTFQKCWIPSIGVFNGDVYCLVGIPN